MHYFSTNKNTYNSTTEVIGGSSTPEMHREKNIINLSQQEMCFSAWDRMNYSSIHSVSQEKILFDHTKCIEND